MGTQRIRSLVVAGLVSSSLFALGACGGAQDSPPRPLSRHFDDVFLAQIAVDQRRDEITAKQAYDIAVLEQQKATADYDASKNQLDLAKNERDKARIDEKSAQSNQKAAQASADMNRMKEADTQLKTAQAAKEAAEARYDYLTAYRDWLKRLMRYTEHNMYWKESQYELAQAKLAQANSIQPKGFTVDDYTRQEGDRQRKTEDAKAKADDEKKDATAARQKWVAMQKSADKMSGKSSDYADPMANVQGVDFELGTDVKTQDGGGTQGVQDPTVNSNKDGDGGDGDNDDDGNDNDDGGTSTP
jgi:hypothetical protein